MVILLYKVCHCNNEHIFNVQEKGNIMTSIFYSMPSCEVVLNDGKNKEGMILSGRKNLTVLSSVMTIQFLSVHIGSIRYILQPRNI